MSNRFKSILLLSIWVIVGVAVYFFYKATFANLHVILAEEEDLRLFPEIGQELNFSLRAMMIVIVVLAVCTSALLVKRDSSSQK